MMARNSANRLVIGGVLDSLRSLPHQAIDLVYLDAVPYSTCQSEFGLPRQLRLFDSTKQAEGGKSVWPEYGMGDFDVINEIARILGVAGSVYVHCWPETEPSWQVLLDDVFGRDGFRKQIVWQPRHRVSNWSRHSHELLLLYSKSASATTNPVYRVRARNIEAIYRFTEHESGRRYALGDCVSPRERPNLRFAWNGHVRTWRWSREEMKRLDAAGRLIHSSSGLPRYKRYLEEASTQQASSVWADLTEQVSSKGADQVVRPESLFARIIETSSNPGDVVLAASSDIQTFATAAQRLGRRWIAIVPTQRESAMARARLQQIFGSDVFSSVVVQGGPTTLSQAGELARIEPFQFKCWLLGLAAAMPVDRAEQRIDGKSTFQVDSRTHEIVYVVRTERLSDQWIEDLEQIRRHTGASIAVLLTLEELTRADRAALRSMPTVRLGDTRLSPLQAFAVKDLMLGDRPHYPGAPVTLRRRMVRATPTPRERRRSAS